jgi:hypothetical protein
MSPRSKSAPVSEPAGPVFTVDELAAEAPPMQSCPHPLGSWARDEWRLAWYASRQSDMKQCCVCQQFKPATREYFNADTMRVDGLRSECKPCRRGRHRKPVE